MAEPATLVQQKLDKFRWRCDSCGNHTFRTITREKAPQLLWKCCKCKQVHMASTAYPVCWNCGRQQYIMNYGSRAISCIHCHSFAQDKVTGWWYFGLDAPLDLQPFNQNEQAADPAKRHPDSPTWR